MLLPLPESRFLGLNLFREAFPKLLFLLLELWVVALLDFRLAKLARLHLLLAVILIMVLLRGGDQIQHVSTNQERAELLEVAVILILDYGRAKLAE